MSVPSTITPVRYTQFGRLGWVEIRENGKPVAGLETKGLDFKFRTSELFLEGNQTPSSATIQLLGLSRESVDYLCQACDFAAYRQRNITARVMAGYESEDNEPQMLFEMLVTKAVPSMPPDNWVTLTTVMDMSVERMKSYSFSNDLSGASKTSSKTTIKDLLEDIAKTFKFKWNWHEGATQAATDNFVDYFGVDGSANDVIEALRKRFPFLLLIQNIGIDPDTNEHTIYDIWLNSNYERQPDGTYISRFVGSSRNTWDVDSAHGMIGMPSYVEGTVGARKIAVRTLLNPGYAKNDIIRLKSVFFTDLSAKKYRIYTVAHSGHLRGNEWYSDLQCIEYAE